MQVRKERDYNICQKSGRINQACMRYGVGKTTMRNIAKEAEAEAEIKIGKCYLINFSKVDDYMDSLSGTCGEE